MLCGVLAFGQSRVVAGKIVDDKGIGIPGASIKVENSAAGTSTGSDGDFSIRVSSNNVLVVTASGYESQKITVGAQNFVSATLKSTETSLQEVVVSTVLGQVRQKSSLGVATATVKNVELTQGRSTNLAQGLTAKVAGASIQQTNSGVGQDTRIVLRGIRSLTGNNQPMLILDGVPISLGYFNSINPNDIQDVTILKSATSTGIYGPDGVNGAIVVTTKRGSKLKPQITLSHSTQIESIAYLPDFQTRYGAGYSQNTSTGLGVFASEEQQQYGPEYDGSIRQLGEDGPGGIQIFREYSYLPGGRKSFWDKGITNQTDVSFNTGDFYLSGQNSDVKGTVPGDELNRRGITLRAEKEYNKFKAVFNVRYSQIKSNTTTQNTQIYYGITGAPGNIRLRDFADWRNDYWSSPNGYYTPYLTNFGLTPYFAKDNNRAASKTDDVFGNVEFNYNAASWVNFVYRVGLSVSSTDGRTTRGAFEHSDFYTTRPNAGAKSLITAAVTESNNYTNRITSEAFANFNKTFRDIEFTATVGHSYRESRSKFASVGSPNVGQTEFISLAGRLGELTGGVDNSLAKLQRFFGRAGFNFNKWLYLEGTASYDRDSRLVPANKIFQTSDISFFYPGANASFLLHEVIPGFKSNNVINFFKVRAAIARTGNVNIAPYANETGFASGQFFPFAVPGFQIGNTVYPAAGLKPEFVNTKEIGVELGFFKNRVNFEANYYTQDNTDQILNVQLSNTTGATTAVLNAGSFTNSGVELDLKLTPLFKFNDVSIDFKINYANQKSNVTSLIDGVSELGIGNYNFAVVNSPAFVYKVTDYVRDSATGKVIVDRLTGLPSLNSLETQIGQTQPKHILGLNLSATWNNITFSAVGQYSSGNQIIVDQLGGFLDDNGVSARSAADGRRQFVFPNSVVDDGTGKLVENTNIFTTLQGRLFYNTDLNTGAITNYMASGAFWKLREVSLTYTFPTRLFKGNGLKGVAVGFSGRNLLTWLPKSNQWTDPEFTANGNSAYTGNAIGRSTAYNMPPTRFMGANVTFTF